MTTIYQVSELANVSLATVSRVVNNSAKVSDSTRLKVEKAMFELGYIPNSVAVSLASKRSNCVGILVPSLNDMFFGAMVASIEKELRKNRKHIVVTAGHGEKSDEIAGIEFLKSHNCDALIIHAEVLSDEYLLALSKSKTPIYIMNRHIPDIAQRCLSLDNTHGGYLATKHVLDKGHTDIVNITGPHYKMDSILRVDGFNNALAQYNIKIAPFSMYEGNYLRESGADAVEYFLAKKVHFTAMVCGNDQMAIGAMARLRYHGYTPAKDIAIIGFDDFDFAACTFPRLTTINYPIGEMGKVAADLILEEVYSISMAEISRVFEPTLILRDSVHTIGE